MKRRPSGGRNGVMGVRAVDDLGGEGEGGRFAFHDRCEYVVGNNRRDGSVSWREQLIGGTWCQSASSR